MAAEEMAAKQLAEQKRLIEEERKKLDEEREAFNKQLEIANKAAMNMQVGQEEETAGSSHSRNPGRTAAKGAETLSLNAGWPLPHAQVTKSMRSFQDQLAQTVKMAAMLQAQRIMTGGSGPSMTTQVPTISLPSEVDEPPSKEEIIEYAL